MRSPFNDFDPPPLGSSGLARRRWIMTLGATLGLSSCGIIPRTSILGGESVCYARGYGGQMIYIIPAAAITVVMRSEADRRLPPEGYLPILHRLIERYIIPASR